MYNIDFLFRKYGYKLGEVKEILDDDMLPREDPKVLMARNYFDGHVEVNDLTKSDIEAAADRLQKLAFSSIQKNKKSFLIKKAWCYAKYYSIHDRKKLVFHVKQLSKALFQ